MKTALFRRLALTGIRNNRNLYLPYWLSCIGMVMMYFIVQSLSCSPLLARIKGGSSIGSILGLGKFVIAVFAMLFLLYTNSFLIKRRVREFGLYNVLGMDKRKIGKILLWESLMTAIVGLGGGLVLGIAFSKLAELGLLNVIHHDVTYGFAVSGKAIGMTVTLFGAIFLLLTVKSLWQVRRCDPLKLMRQEAAGERPPKANWIPAVLGVILLGTAYAMSVSIQSPLSALLLFFVAVILVIVATYLLMMAGSVALCKLLQKNKRYYYQKHHFVSVSSMAYRMKRNGAGLASICILATMVLVTVSSTSSLYFGANDAMEDRFPRQTEFTVGIDRPLTPEEAEEARSAFGSVFEKHAVTPKNLFEYRYACIAGLLTKDRIDPDAQSYANMLDYDRVRQLYFISIDDFDRVTGGSHTLTGQDALLLPIRCRYDREKLTVGDVHLDVAGTLTDFPYPGEINSLAVPAMIVVIADYDLLHPLDALWDTAGEPMLSYEYYYSYDLDGDDDRMRTVYREQDTTVKSLSFISSSYRFSGGCLAEEKDDFLMTFGGLFFLGILLSAVFLFGAAMIIYYKQISEGYEDRNRFAIMQKIGMTKEDIRKSINSQVLTVFFAPLLLAGLHLCFAFPIIWKLLQIFHLKNVFLVLGVTAGAFVCFAVMYALLYKATARAYYSIVSRRKES